MATRVFGFLINVFFIGGVLTAVLIAFAPFILIGAALSGR